MFVLDMPDVPPPYAPVIIAQASQAQQVDARMDRTVGVCQVVENPAFPPTPGGISAYNGMGNPAEWVKRYFKVQENRTVEGAAQIAVLQKPEHGTVELDSNGRYWYFPVKDYVGQDRATLLVEIGDVKVKLIYFFHVEKGPLDNEAEEGTCPTPYWRVSLNPDDPNAPVYTFEHPSQLTNPLLGAIQAKLTIADLPSGALGQTTGTTITLDDNAAGFGWFIGPSMASLPVEASHWRWPVISVCWDSPPSCGRRILPAG